MGDVQKFACGVAIGLYHARNSVFNGVCNSDYRWKIDDSPTECSEDCGGGELEYEVYCYHEGNWKDHDNNCYYWTMPEPRVEEVGAVFRKIIPPPPAPLNMLT